MSCRYLLQENSDICSKAQEGTSSAKNLVDQYSNEKEHNTDTCLLPWVEEESSH